MLQERLKSLISKLGVSRREFASDIGVSYGNVSSWLRSENPPKPSAEALEKLYEVYSVNITWLITGNGEMFVPKVMSKDKIIVEYYKELHELKKLVMDMQEGRLEKSDELMQYATNAIKVFIKMFENLN